MEAGVLIRLGDVTVLVNLPRARESLSVVPFHVIAEFVKDVYHHQLPGVLEYDGPSSVALSCAGSLRISKRRR